MRFRWEIGIKIGFILFAFRKRRNDDAFLVHFASVLTRRVPLRDSMRLSGETFASAGAVDANFMANNFCSSSESPDHSPDASPGWRVWLPIKWHHLSAPSGREACSERRFFPSRYRREVGGRCRGGRVRPDRFRSATCADFHAEGMLCHSSQRAPRPSSLVSLSRERGRMTGGSATIYRCPSELSILRYRFEMVVDRGGFRDNKKVNRGANLSDRKDRVNELHRDGRSDIDRGSTRLTYVRRAFGSAAASWKGALFRSFDQRYNFTLIVSSIVLISRSI